MLSLCYFLLISANRDGHTPVHKEHLILRVSVACDFNRLILASKISYSEETHDESVSTKRSLREDIMERKSFEASLYSGVDFKRSEKEIIQIFSEEELGKAEPSLKTKLEAHNLKSCSHRDCVESCIEFLKEFDILNTIIDMSLEKARIVVMACIVLHNFRVKFSVSKVWVPEDMVNDYLMDTSLLKISKKGNFF